MERRRRHQRAGRRIQAVPRRGEQERQQRVSRLVAVTAIEDAGDESGDGGWAGESPLPSPSPGIASDCSSASVGDNAEVEE
ncbi:Os04g0459300 [Oryza sativa Japonica Group]|uniref:Os04g0459300 protein n=1 Tax=Oryza sativa subsp. japonica TaxID=39947 RepID=A0A0P0WB89_ORYSJ|nr:Os04g0459300 [Oryza sativa Japonica Group]